MVRESAPAFNDRRDDFAGFSQPDERPAPRRLTPSAQFLEGPDEVEYLIPGVLAKGQPCIVGGPAKCLKTLVSLDLAYSLASGTPFLGRFPVPKPVRVSVISLESGGPTLRAKAKVIARAKGVPAVQDGLTIDAEWMVRLPAALNELVDVVRHAQADVVILDPLYQIVCGAAGVGSSLPMMGEVLRSFSELGMRTGATVVVNHHTNKGLAVGTVPDFTHLNGAGVAEWARQFLLLNRHTAYVPGTPVNDLVVTAGGSAGHSGAWRVDITEEASGTPCWSVAIADIGGAPAPGRGTGGKRSVVKDRVLTILREKSPAALSQKQVRNYSRDFGGEISGGQACKYLDALVNDGLAVKIVTDDMPTFRFRQVGDTGDESGDAGDSPCVPAE